MTEESGNPILNMAFALMEAVAPGGLNDPAKAWRELVPRLRYVVIAKTENPSVTQLKAVQSFSSSFFNFQGHNLLEIRKALAQGELRLEPAPEDFAAPLQKTLAETGLQVNLVPLTEEEQAKRLEILNE